MKLLLGAIIAAAYLVATVSCEGITIIEDKIPYCKLPYKADLTNFEVDLIFNLLDTDVYEGQVHISLDIPKIRVFQNEISRDTNCWFYITDAGKKVKKIFLIVDETLEIDEVSVSLSLTLSTNEEIKGIRRDRSLRMFMIELKRELELPRKAEVSISFRGRMPKKIGGVNTNRNDGNQVFEHIMSQFRRIAPFRFEKEVPFRMTLHNSTVYENTKMRTL